MIRKRSDADCNPNPEQNIPFLFQGNELRDSKPGCLLDEDFAVKKKKKEK